MKKGIGIFGKQYEIGYKNDVQADGSVVKTLFEEMIKLDSNSVEYLYSSYTDLSNRYEPESRIFLEDIVNNLKSPKQAETVDNIISYCMNIAENYNIDTDDMIFGGTEEEILKRGTYWCTDMARIACVMFQTAGLPSRIIITANTKFAYSGHTVTEVYYDNKWGVADPAMGKIFRHNDGTPISAWDIKINNIDEQYESIGISNYYIDEHKNYNYETSRVNAYYREILKHSNDSWADGIRWIHGEDFNIEK